MSGSADRRSTRTSTSRASTHVLSTFDDRVVGISVPQLRAVPRRVAVAGGERKVSAILGAVRGGWVNVLVTDLQTARRLVESAREGDDVDGSPR